jgi:aryl-alcohol dehydrogenase-like predicted oxidoreductase
MTTPTQSAPEQTVLGGDLPLRRIGYGGMRLSDAAAWLPLADRTAATTLLRRAADLGVNFFDGADAYALGAVDELIAEALYPYQDDVVVASKVGFVRAGVQEWTLLGRPDYLRQQAELGLRRLRKDTIDLLYLHRIDPAVDLADQIGALKQLQDEGKVRHIGLCEVTVDELQQAQQIAPIASVQSSYNLAARDHDPVVDYAAENGIVFVPFFPIGTGSLAGAESPVAAVADEVGATLAQTALAWLLKRSTTILPIPGTSSVAHLEENVGALKVALSDDQFERLSKVS